MNHPGQSPWGCQPAPGGFQTLWQGDQQRVARLDHKGRLVMWSRRTETESRVDWAKEETPIALPLKEIWHSPTAAPETLCTVPNRLQASLRFRSEKLPGAKCRVSISSLRFSSQSSISFIRRYFKDLTVRSSFVSRHCDRLFCLPSVLKALLFCTSSSRNPNAFVPGP